MNMSADTYKKKPVSCLGLQSTPETLLAHSSLFLSFYCLPQDKLSQFCILSLVKKKKKKEEGLGKRRRRKEEEGGEGRGEREGGRKEED